MVKLLLERDGIELNPRNRMGRTTLIRAAEEGHIAVVKLLLEQESVELNLTDELGLTALSRAANRGQGGGGQACRSSRTTLSSITKTIFGLTPHLWATEPRTTLKL